MGETPIPKSVKAHMSKGETPLWWTVSDRAVRLSDSYGRPKTSKRTKWLSFGIVALTSGFLIFINKDNPDFSQTILSSFVTMIPYVLVYITVSWVLNKYPQLNQFKKILEPHGIYQNLVMTDRQLIAFNMPEEPLFIPRDIVTSVDTDFENGGPALRIKARDTRDTVIIGTANFKIAKHQFYATHDRRAA